MKHLKNLLTIRLQQVPTKFVAIILVIALLGFFDATYLTIKHFQGVIPPCSVVSGCETVLTSSYSVVAGIPVSLLGSIYYLVIAIGLFAYIDTKKTNILKWTLLLTIAGLIMSIWFIILQAFVIKAWCLYCLGSAGSSVALFVCAGMVFSKYSVCHSREGDSAESCRLDR